MSNIDFSRPRRMGWSALVVLLWDFLKENLMASLAVLYFLLRGGRWGVWALPLYGVLLIQKILQFCTLRYFIEDGVFYVQEHYIFLRRNISLPIDRIHNITSHSNLFCQMTDMVKLQIDSTASDEVEIKLILTLEEAEQLRAFISVQERGVLDMILHDVDVESLEPPPRHIDYDPRRLLSGILVQSHVRSVGVVGTALLALWQDISEYLGDSLGFWLSKVMSYGDQVNLEEFLIAPTGFLLGLLVVYMLLVLLWTVQHALRMWGTKISLYPQYLTHTAGLLTSLEKRIRASQIVAMSFKQNPLERLTGQCTLRLSQSRTEKKEEKRVDGSGLRIFGWREEAELMQWWGIDANIICDISPSRRMLYFWVGVCLLLHLIAALTLVLSEASSWILVLLPTLAMGLWWAVGSYRHLTFALTPTHLYVRHGGTAEVRSWVPYRRIDLVSVEQHPLQRRSGRCRLIISAMNNKYSMGFASLQEASAFRDKLLYLIER